MWRRGDRWGATLLLSGLLASSISLVIAGQARSPMQEFIDRDQSGRITTIESLRIPERLAVLERIAQDSAEQRTLIYGVMATLACSLIVQILQIRSNVSRRSHGLHDE